MLLALASVLALTSLLGVGATSAIAFPPSATTTAATSVTLTSATLNGVANSFGTGTEYWFEYGKTEAYGKKTTVVKPGGEFSKAVSANVTSLEDSEYHFRLVVKNTEGTAYGADMKFEYVGTWHSQASENTGELVSELRDASCVSSEYSCAAVGLSTAGAGGRPLIERTAFSGKWQIQASPPLALTGHSLESVSCVSPTNCVAVGYYNNGIARHALAEHWNGKEWKTFLFPAVGGDSSELNGVSCTSTTHCMAVGQLKVGASVQSVIVRWSGFEWYNEIPSVNARLLDVSCASATACTAVGTMAGSSNAVITAWNGAEWKNQTPASSVGLALSGVSCTAANACTAVSETSPANTLVAQRWNGTKWETQTTATLTGATSVKGFDVSCASATRCVSVGSYVNSSGVGTALIERWNGVSWTLQSAPAAPPGTTSPVLRGVTCFAPSLCSAVGTYNTGGGAGQTFATSLY